MPNSVYDVYIRVLWLMNNISKYLHVAVVCLMNTQADVFFLMVWVIPHLICKHRALQAIVSRNLYFTDRHTILSIYLSLHIS